MSIFSKLKRSLGFDHDDDTEYDSLYEDTASGVDTVAASDVDNPKADASADDALKPVEFKAEMQQAIFSKVVEMFDAALPDFISKAVDPEAQRKMLYDSLDQDVKAYMQSIITAAEAYCEARWKVKQSSMSSELEALKLRAGEIEKQSSDIKQKQLSADRQKRALTERVHDLESQLAKLESEREQFELENRSLVNRIKVANVQQEDLEKTQGELQALRQELNSMKQNPDNAFAKREEELNKQIAEMSEGIASLKEQLRVSEQMREDLRKRIAEDADTRREADANASKQLQEKLQELDKVSAELEQFKKDYIAKANEVNELNQLLKDYDELNARMSEFDKVMTSQQDKIKSQKKIIEQKDAEIDNLKASIAENKRAQTEREKSLKAEIEALRPPTVVSEMQVDFGSVAEETAPRISEDDLTAMEEAFESGEWFTKTPPAETPSLRPSESETDFGYRAPRRKSPQVNNPDQLSLF